MTKGNNSKNSLKALAYPLQRFLNGWGAREKPTAPSLHIPTDGHAKLPAPYELAALRGEGILRERFFGAFMEKLPVTLDAGQQIAAWQDLVEHGGHITAWIERLGLVKAMRREAVMPLLNPANVQLETRKLYALLLDTLHIQAPELLPWAVEGYLWHCWKQKFPSESTHQSNDTKTDASVLRERLQRSLRKQHGNGVEIKESFTQGSETVNFTILWRPNQHTPWQTVRQLERPRLKTARLAAYTEAIQSVQI